MYRRRTHVERRELEQQIFRARSRGTLLSLCEREGVYTHLWSFRAASKAGARRNAAGRLAEAPRERFVRSKILLLLLRSAREDITASNGKTVPVQASSGTIVQKRKY